MENNGIKSKLIIKMGGSVLTDKSAECVLGNQDDLKVTIEAILSGIQAGHDIILVCGTGSFGHPPAKRYGLKEGGPVDQAELEHAIDITRKSVLKLCEHVSKAFERHGVNIKVLSPFDHVTAHDGKVSADKYDAFLPHIARCLEENSIPMLHGDVVRDVTNRCAIESSDCIAYKLGLKLQNISRFIFITDVQGVFDKNPKDYEDAKHIPWVNINSLMEISCKDDSDRITDVTGRMGAKLASAANIVAVNQQRVVVIGTTTQIPWNDIFCDQGIEPGAGYSILISNHTYPLNLETAK